MVEWYVVDQKFIDVVPLFFETWGEKETLTAANTLAMDLHSRAPQQSQRICDVMMRLCFSSLSGLPAGPVYRNHHHIPDSLARLSFFEPAGVYRLFAELQRNLLRKGTDDQPVGHMASVTFKNGGTDKRWVCDF